MVLFGGRNWTGKRTLREYGFEDLADRHGLALVSPSFVDNDYWKPEAWSGAALTNELARIERENGISFSRICLYGYSAGGQCAALFQAWWPGGVTAWGAHGCGVFPARVSITRKKLNHTVEDKVLNQELKEFVRVVAKQYAASSFQLGTASSAETFLGRAAISDTYLAYAGDTEVKGYIIGTSVGMYLVVFHFCAPYDEYVAMENVMKYMVRSVQAAG